ADVVEGDELDSPTISAPFTAKPTREIPAASADIVLESAVIGLAGGTVEDEPEPATPPAAFTESVVPPTVIAEPVIPQAVTAEPPAPVAGPVAAAVAEPPAAIAESLATVGGPVAEPVAGPVAAAVAEPPVV